MQNAVLFYSAFIQLHFGAPNDFIRYYLLENGLLSELTNDENTRLEESYDSWEEQDKTDLYWSIEAIWALAWAGKKHSNLTLNTGVENSLSSCLPNFQENESAKGFIENFSLRSEKEIFTTLDSFYRAHWFARNHSLAGQKSSLVDLDIIIERRKALEWICNIEENWDEVSLDT